MSDDRRDAGSQPGRPGADELGRLIRAAVPAHRPGFWQQLNDRLERAGEDGGPSSGGNPGQAHDRPTRKDTTMSLTLPPEPDGTRPPVRDELNDLRSARRRWVPPAVAAGIIGIALGASALVGLTGDGVRPADPAPTSVTTPVTTPAANPSASPGPSAGPSARSSKAAGDDQDRDDDKAFGRLYPPTGRDLTPLEQLDPDLALSGFGNAGPLKVTGKPAFAYQWTDAAGDNLMVLSAVRTSSEHDDGETYRDSTLYVTTFRMGEDPSDGGRVTTTKVRTMVEPGSGPCELGYPDGFLPQATQLSDTDGDGVGEISVGWYFDCRGEIGQDNIRIAVLEGADKYILRGTAYRFEGAREDVGGEPMTRAPDPAASSWPKGLYQHAVQIWDSVAW